MGETDIEAVFGKLTINNFNNVKVNTGINILINNALQFETGIFDIGQNLLTMAIASTFVEQNSYSSTNMVSTNKSFTDSGIKKFFPSGASSFVFPLGSGGNYTPIKIIVTQNSSSNGYLIVKAAAEVHPTITEDAETPDTEIIDVDNALQYYWSLKADNFSNGIGTVEFYYDESDVVYTNGYDETDYIAARLLADGSGNWNKYDWDDFVENNNKIVFTFNNVTNVEITGDYTAGVQPDSPTRYGAIPDQVPGYISILTGDWTSIATWDTYPVSGGTIPTGGPSGAMVIIDNNDTVTIDQNYIKSYSTDIRGTLKQEDKFGNRLGIVNGTGILSTETGLLPAGYYVSFLSQTGGTLEYTGADDTDILNNIAQCNNLILSGTGERRFPNLDIVILGNLLFSDVSGSSPDVINEFDKKISINGNITIDAGTFDAGTGTNAIFKINGTTAQILSGNADFTGANAFNYFEMNNPNGLTLNTPIDIEQDLTFSDGVIHTDQTNVLTLTNPAEDIVNNAGNGLYVDGPCNKYLQTGDEFNFPVGNDSRFGQLNINNVICSGTETWQAQYFNYNPNDDSYDPESFTSPLKYVSHNEFWNINGPIAGTAYVKLRWDGSSGVSSDATDRTFLRISEWSTGNSQWEQSHSNNTASGSATSGNITTATTIIDLANNHYFALSSTLERIITWDGSESTVWNNADNWTPAIVPTSVANATIPTVPAGNAVNFPIIDIAAETRDLTIASSAIVTINAAKSLTLSGDFSNSGTLILKSPLNSTAGASFIDNGIITGTGIIKVERFFTKDEFHYVSSPVQTGDINSGLFTRSNPSGNYNGNFYDYNETVDLDGDPLTAPTGGYNPDNLGDGWTFAHNGEGGADENLVTKKGYAFYTDISQLITCQGTPNTGDMSVSGLNYTDNDPTAGPLPNYYDGWNLVGNPYPSTIDWDLIKTGLTNLDEGIYVWDGTQYASYSGDISAGSGNLDNNISPMQAFYVRANNTNGGFILNNSHRKHNTNDYLKKEKKQKVDNIVKLKINANGYNDYIAIYFNENATLEYDGHLDAFCLFSNNNSVPNLYSITKGQTPLKINALPIQNLDSSYVPLGLRLNTSGTYTISNESLIGLENAFILLEDTYNDTIINLKTNSYTFDFSAGDTKDRFILRFFLNNAPVLTYKTENHSSFEDQEYNFTLNANTFIDNDYNDEISYSISLANGDDLPDWLSFNSETLSFIGTPKNEDVEILEIKLVATDLYNESTSTIFELEIINSNDAPILNNKIIDQFASENMPFSFTFPENTFIDVDAGDILDYSATSDSKVKGLPLWLNFNEQSRTFFGNPTEFDLGTITITLIASDQTGIFAFDKFDITVKSPTNSNNLNNSNILVYPNPNNGVFNIETYQNDNFELTIINMLGQTVHYQKLNSNINNIDITSVDAGSYILKIKNNEQIIYHKIIIQ